MGMKYITCIVTLILQLSAFAVDKSDLHWTQKIFIKEKTSSKIKEKEATKCQDLAKENNSNFNDQKLLLKNECYEKKQ